MKLPMLLHTLILLQILACAVSSSTSPQAADTKLLGVGPDRFVSSAPLIVGAVCCDGVVLVTAHTMFAEEPLLLDESEEEVDNEKDGKQKFKDLPKEYRGPFRIYSVDDFGTSLACCGWRADGQILAKYFRHLAKEEKALFGVPRQRTSQYGSFLSSEASSWIARTALSEKFRSLSCAGLLASCGEPNKPGYLFLVDITGPYQIKAHALGAGAAQVNEKLAATDFSKLSQKEACQKIVEILSDAEGLPDTSRLEIATVGGPDSGKSKRRMKRLLTSQLMA